MIFTSSYNVNVQAKVMQQLSGCMLFTWVGFHGLLLISFFLSNQVDLPESEKLTLSLCLHKDRSSAWKAIYFECLSRGRHFLEQVLVSTLRSGLLFYFLFVLLFWMYLMLVFNHVWGNWIRWWCMCPPGRSLHWTWLSTRSSLSWETYWNWSSSRCHDCCCSWDGITVAVWARLKCCSRPFTWTRSGWGVFPVQTSTPSFKSATLLVVLLPFQAPANDSVLQEFADVLSSQLGILEWCNNKNT